jgi:hypothetical protein
MVELTGTNVATGHGCITPRTGTVYRIDEKTVLRAGYGINTNGESFRNNVQNYLEVPKAMGSRRWMRGWPAVGGRPGAQTCPERVPPFPKHLRNVEGTCRLAEVADNNSVG